MRRLAFIAITALLVLVGCGDDDPTSPRRTGGTGNETIAAVSVSTPELDFGVTCMDGGKVMNFSITAGADNTTDVTGDVAVVPGTESSHYEIVGGAGNYTLAPGESHQVRVRYGPQELYRQHDAEVSIGVDDITVACTGYSSRTPFYSFDPRSRTDFGPNTNYRAFAERNAVTLLLDDNVSYEKPGWVTCGNATWIFNGNSITESRVGLDINVPAGTSTMTVTVTLEAEGTCTQFLIQVDGKEHRWDGLPKGCSRKAYNVSVAPGRQRIYVGTDQSSFCGDDLSIWNVEFRFNRTCLSPDEIF